MYVYTIEADDGEHKHTAGICSTIDKAKELAERYLRLDTTGWVFAVDIYEVSVDELDNKLTEPVSSLKFIWPIAQPRYDDYGRLLPDVRIEWEDRKD